MSQNIHFWSCSALKTFAVLCFIAFSAFTTTIAQTPVSSAGENNSASPTAKVQSFYAAMRERRFRDAMMMTNLRAAVENLMPQEIEDLRQDFEPMATRVPEKIETNGEQISGDAASVFIKATDPISGELKLDELKLRRENNNWVVITLSLIHI